MKATGSEIEWQLEVSDVDAVKRWLDGAVELAAPHQEDHVDTYLDTPDRKLEAAGYSVRLRRRDGAPVEATLKSLGGDSGAGLKTRVELEETLEAAEPAAVARAPGIVGRRVRELVGPVELVRRFDIRTRRLVFPFAAGELLLDETEIRDASQRVLGHLSRVEVEIPEGAIADAEPLVERLRRECGLEPAVLSKYETALAASGVQPNDGKERQ
jgi:inorganic triphosphatase YgiF